LGGGDALGLCSLAGAGGALILEAEWLERHAGDGRETRSTQDPETGRAETNGRYNPGVLFVVVLRKALAQLPPSRRSPSTDGPSALTAEDFEREIFKKLLDAVEGFGFLQELMEATASMSLRRRVRTAVQLG
jgi:hypothetical protein